MRFPSMRMTIAISLGLMAIPLAQAQAGVVVASSGPSAKTYPVGKKIADSGTIVLKAGDTVTILDAKGSRVFRGAGNHSLASGSVRDRSGTIALLTRQRSAQRMRTGAVRDDLTGPVSRPNLWYVDVRQPGAMCLANPSEIRLWRPATEGEALYAIAGDGSQASSKATFSDGEMLTVWDLSESPVTDGASYMVAGKDGAPTKITFRVLDAVPTAPEDLALKLIELGCTAQLEVLTTATLDVGG